MLIKMFARACVGLGLLAAATPGFAASPATDAVLANMRLRAVFVVRASELAADRAGSETLRSFAASEAGQQCAMLAALDGTPAPHDAVADLAQPMTGRSVGKDAVGKDAEVDPSTFTPPSGLGALMPAATASLDRLASLKDEDFDRLYVAVVDSVLGDEAAILQAYGKTGDDVAVRALATNELPRLTAAIAAPK